MSSKLLVSYSAHFHMHDSEHIILKSQPWNLENILPDFMFRIMANEWPKYIPINVYHLINLHSYFVKGLHVMHIFLQKNNELINIFFSVEFDNFYSA